MGNKLIRLASASAKRNQFVAGSLTAEAVLSRHSSHRAGKVGVGRCSSRARHGAVHILMVGRHDDRHTDRHSALLEASMEYVHDQVSD